MANSFPTQGTRFFIILKDQLQKAKEPFDGLFLQHHLLYVGILGSYQKDDGVIIYLDRLKTFSETLHLYNQCSESCIF